MWAVFLGAFAPLREIVFFFFCAFLRELLSESHEKAPPRRSGMTAAARDSPSPK